MNKLLFYPFSEDGLSQILWFEKLMPEYTISEIVAPKGLGVDGRDIGYISNRKTGRVATSDIDDAIRKCDTLFVPFGSQDDPAFSKVFSVIQKALYHQKDVICLYDLPTDVISFLEKEYKNFTYIAPNSDLNDFSTIRNKLEKTDKWNRLYAPSAFVIFVGGLFDIPRIDENYYMIISRLKDKGYRVSAIGRQRFNEFASFHAYPEWLLNNSLDGVEMILRLNEYIKHIDLGERPEVIVVEVPGAFIKYNNTFHNDFGFYPYIFSHAVEPDYFICCTLHDQGYPYFVERLSNAVEQKYGYPINYIDVTNYVIDIQDSKVKKELAYQHLSIGSVEHTENEHIKRSDLTCLPAQDEVTDCVIAVLNEKGQKPYSVLLE